MQIKRYMAADMRQALKQVRDEQGPDAVILSSRQLPDGLEVVAAVDYDEHLIHHTLERTRTPAAPARPAGDETSLSTMRDEINALRRMLEGQLSSLAWHDFSRQSPVRANLLRNLIHLGLAPALAQDLAARVPVEERDPARAWRRALGELARLLPVAEQDPVDAGGVIALVGPTGVGKTTTIARLAARYAGHHGPQQVAMISTDDSGPGAQERLFSFGRLLNIPVYRAANAGEVHEWLARLGHARLVLVDTAGTVRDDHCLQQAAALVSSGGRPVTPWLVLAANAQIQALEEAVMLYRRLPLGGLMVTKLDEAASLGGLLSVVASSGLPLAYVSDAQDLSRPLRSASARKLVKRAVSVMRASPRRMDVESLAQHIGEVHYAIG
ncbi:MAG: flagellar biosynthesis protein FlhF [Haliea sp.]